MGNISITEASPSDVAADLIHGRTVVIPTETVYGLAIQPGNADAARRVFALKGRPSDLNLPVIIGSLDQLDLLGVDVNDVARDLAAHFWPGPLTLVFGFDPARRRAPWLDGRVEVAVRLTALEFLRAVALEMGPFLVTSANAHGKGATLTAGDATASLLGEPDVVIDGGRLSSMPSTIVNTRHRPARIERFGSIDIESLRRVAGAAAIMADDHA